MSVTSLSARAELRPPVRRRRAGAVAALVRRDWRIIRSYRTALVTDMVFGFLNLAAYYYISKTLKPAVHNGLDGAPTYFAFAAVGVALTVVLQASVIGLSRRLREEQLTGTLEALIVQPISVPELACGLAGFPFLFAVARAFVYLLLAGAFLGLDFAHCDWVGLGVSFLVAGVAFAGLGVGLAAVVLVFKRADSLGAIGTFGMGLIGGAFFPVHVLPDWLRPVADIVPTRYAFTAVRGALFGAQDWVAPAATLAGIGVITTLMGLGLFALALRHTVRRGTLGQY